METAGLQRIIALCREFNFGPIEKQLDILQDQLDDDEAKLKERLDQEILRDLTDLEDVYNALKARTEGTRAHDYLLSMLQHLLLIREEGPLLDHHYQLIDTLVSDVVMDKKLGGAEARLGQSVERIIGQFNDADQYKVAEADAARARTEARLLQLENDALKAEVEQGSEGLVGQLKVQMAHMEEKLTVSRENCSRLQGQLASQKAGYEEQIAQLEAQIMELFRMLREVGKGVDQILDSGGMDRKTLMDTLEKHLQRNKTIEKLEGWEGERPRRKKRNKDGEEESETDDDDVGATPGKSSLKRRTGSKKNGRSAKSARMSEAQNARASQFMDADEADVQEQVQQQLAAGVKIVSIILHLFSPGILLNFRPVSCARWSFRESANRQPFNFSAPCSRQPEHETLEQITEFAQRYSGRQE